MDSFFGMMVEGTTVIILSGVLCHMGVLPCEKTLLVAILGGIAGDQMWFFIGRNYATKLLARFPKIEKELKKVESKIQSKADVLATTSRFIYGGAVLFPLVLSMNNYSHKRFILLDSIGVSLASIAGMTLGYFLSNSFHKLLGAIGHVEHLFMGIIIISIGIKLYFNYRKHNV